MTILYGLIAMALGICATFLYHRIDKLNESLWEMRTQLRMKETENERLMDCIIEIERETGEME